MAGNGALDLSIRIMGKVDPSLVTAIKQTKGLTGDLASALTGTKSLGSTVANTLGVIGKTGLGIMATLTTASAVMIKKTTSMAEEYQAQAADAVKYVGGIMNDDGSIDPEKRATMEDAILKMTTQVPIKRDEMAQIAASLGQSGKNYDISIHALREEGDVPRVGRLILFNVFLSTPSARRATSQGWGGCFFLTYFYPRPPRGGRPPPKIWTI